MPTQGNKSAQNYETAGSEFNRQRFSIAQFIKERVHTAQIVRVVDVFPSPPGSGNSNEEGLFGLVNVELAIKPVDNLGRRVESNTMYNLPYIRLQGGSAAFVLDPKPGDWGLAIFCERDISTFKRTREDTLPGSSRFLSQSDGIYLGGLLNGAPKVFIKVSDSGGIEIESNMLPVTVNCGKATVKAEAYCHIDTPVQAERCDIIYVKQNRTVAPYEEFTP